MVRVYALYYSSEPLSASDRFQHGYQWIVLGVSVFSLFLPFLYYVFLFMRYRLRKYKARPTKIKLALDEDLCAKLRQVNEIPYFEELPSLRHKSPESYASFRGESLEKAGDLSSLDIVSLPLHLSTDGFTDSTASLVLAFCDEARILSDVRLGLECQSTRMTEFMRRIHDRFSQRDPHRGVLLRLSNAFTPGAWMNLSQHLRSLNIRVFLELYPPYTDLLGINLALVDGLIIRNATILEDGLRRDFFHAFELRDVLARCSRQKAKRPDFITILHDPCELPSTPTLRRAFKFARFHEVMLSVCRPDLTRLSHCMPIVEPYSAFDWLKRLDVLDLHKRWNEAVVSGSDDSAHVDLCRLEKVFPGIEASFVKSPYENDTYDVSQIVCQPPQWRQAYPSRASYFTTGENGQLLSNRACYDLRDQILDRHVMAVLETQKHMRHLKLLHEPTVYEKQEIHDRLSPFAKHDLFTRELNKKERSIVQDLIEALQLGRLHVFQGLDSGFCLPDNKFHVWSVAEEDEELGQVIYVSQKCSDLPALLVHTSLLLNGVSRRRCFEIELVMAKSQNLSQGLPPRLVAELRTATHSELITCIQHISISRDADSAILQNVVNFAKYLLIEETTRAAWRKTHGQKVLADEISLQMLYKTRLDWLHSRGETQLPSILALERMHKVVEGCVLRALRRRDLPCIDLMTTLLCDAFSSSSDAVSIETDMVGLMVFCAFRKYGVEETYVESTDRCPIFHFQTDQPGVYSELWVIGSQCEVYFDITPRELGAMHYAKYRKYLQGNPPPDDAWNCKDVFTAYHKVENPTAEGVIPGDAAVINPFKAKGSTFFPRLQRFAFLSIFAIPAVCDVMLLVFLGRGVFQSAFMRSEEIIYGTLGLLTALLLSSGTIGWIGSSGGYYLYNSAFDSLCHVVVQRFSGGLALTLAVGLLGGLGIGSQRGWYPGLIFFLYTLVLSTYLNLLGILATMHRDGSPFPSGRFVLWKSLPVLLISPILTLFVHGHDIIIYMIVLYLFVTILFLNFRKSCAEWSQWYTRIFLIDDSQVLDWYKTDHPPSYDEGEEFNLARAALEAAVIKYRSESRWFPSSAGPQDDLVTKLAPGLEYSRWLLTKDAGPGAEAPLPYSSAWNNSLKVSLNTYQTFVRGLKEHSSFLQFRYAKNEIAYNSAMFIAALLDRWVAITMSAAGDGPLNLYAQPRNRFAIAFALSYFLLSAVALDYQLQYCWTALAATSTQLISSQTKLDNEENKEMSRKRTLYWTSLRDLLVVMLFVFGFWTMILVLWVSDPIQMEFFFAYCLAYSFVVWFQFNRVFVKDPTKAWLVIAAAISVGYGAGVVLHLLPQTRNFRFIDVMALGTCTFLAGLWSFAVADFGPGRDQKEDDIYSPQELMNKTGWKTHSQKHLGLDISSTRSLPKLIQALPISLPSSDFLLVSPAHLPEVYESSVELFSKAQPHWLVCESFPNWHDIVVDVKDRWHHGLTRVYLAHMPHLADVLGITTTSAIGRLSPDGMLDVVVPVPVLSTTWITANSVYLARRIAEAVLHETCEVQFRMSHSDSVCAELLLSDNCIGPTARMQSQIASSLLPAVENIARRSISEITCHLCLGIRVDIQWLYVPEDLRRFVLCRLQGDVYTPDKISISFIQIYLRQGSDLWSTTVKKCDLKVRLAASIDRAARKAIEDQIPTITHAVEYPSIRTNEVLPSPLVRGNDLKRRLFYGIGSFIKYIAVIINADPTVPRELVYASRSSSFRTVGRVVLLFIWRLCARLRHYCIEATLIHSRPELSEILFHCRKGAERRLYTDRVVVRDPFAQLTGFPAVVVGSPRAKALHVYSGLYKVEPDSKQKIRRAIYDDQERLIILESLKDGVVVATSTYQYANDNSRVPICQLKDKPEKAMYRYDVFGRIIQGTLSISNVEWSFSYAHTRDKKSDEILSAHYECKQNNIDRSVTVYWCVRRNDRNDELDPSSWSPTRSVTRTVHRVCKEQWETQYTYHHKRDPTIKCVYMDEHGLIHYLRSPPELVIKDTEMFLTKPKLKHFDADDLLFHHPPLRRWYQRFVHRLPFAPSRTCYIRLSTAVLRSFLWDRWHKSKSLDGVTACYIDDQILRNEPLLRPYWRARDAGRLHAAVQYLDANLESLIASIEVDDAVSQNTFLPYKMTDLYSMGTGGSANVKTRRYEDNYCDTDDRLSVVFLDTGCFPDQPGGVSNCRRDLVNGHTTIRNHVFTESANDFGVPRFQVDRNVQSVKVLPLWGLDYLSPYHGLFDNLLDTQVSQREQHTSERDIRENFLPILRTIIRGSRLQSFTQEDLAEFTQAFVDLSIYFEEKDYLKTWKSDSVKRTWRECWLEDQAGAVSIKTYFGLELPTMAQFDEAMELWTRYFFVFSVRLPDDVPKVFQCTHHGVGSLFGMLLKVRRGTTYMIWDHAIYWRESCLNISSSQCILALSVQNMLLGVIKLASHLCYTHADVILPCTNQFNPGWEADIGSDSGKRQNKLTFYRKIDPVVNGISEMERFVPVDKIRTENPTVMMLSNVQFIKDVKNAVLSADIIVNRFKFTKYRLVIYGAMDRTPQYTAETEAIIRTRGLENNVKLAGFGNPKEILKDAWAFMNSSLSEGLPLAIGEAALSGAPVIATDVGATALVISDPKDPKIRYGEIVPPNDSVALARAQIQILAMLGPWAKYCGDSPPEMPEVFTTEDVEWITQRMYDKTEERRALGLKGRETVLHSFNGNRYLREHEQMYWLGSHRALQRQDPDLCKASAALVKYDEVLPIIPSLPKYSSKMWSQDPWRYFRDQDGFLGRLKQYIKGARRQRNNVRSKSVSAQSKSVELCNLTRVSTSSADSNKSFDSLNKMIGHYYNHNNYASKDVSPQVADDAYSVAVREIDLSSFESLSGPSQHKQSQDRRSRH